MNNSHIIIFDIHSEYHTAFPSSNHLNAETLILPYWLLNEEEMEELYLESGDNNNYNQQSLLRTIITLCKQKSNPNETKVYFDSPLPYDIDEVINCLQNLSHETKDAENDLHIQTSAEEKIFANEKEKLTWYCEDIREFLAPSRSKINKGPFADGSIDKFIRRMITKVNNPRLSFIFAKKGMRTVHESVLKQIMGFEENCKSNISIIDLSGIPFEVLSITVSLITRILFDFGYYYRRLQKQCDVPLLLVYEEAHKYAPRSELARFKASLSAIERIAKEGRKYGTSLLISSQRPSEISETIFSQCSNFIAMRLTNPDDQAYVKRLLPDTLGNLTTGISSLESGQALIIGDSTIMPSLVTIDRCSPEPSSSDISYFEIWKSEWKNVNFSGIAKEWKK